MCAAFLYIPAHAQDNTNMDYLSVFELVDECDLLAAHPFDTQRLSDGVPDDSLIPRLAIIACLDAAEREPQNARFKFQLARAYGALNDRESTLGELKKASTQGYAAANAMLGEYILNIATDDSVLEVATQYFKMALEGGYMEAETLIDSVTPMPNLFVAQSIISSLYSDDLAFLNSSEQDVRVKSYLFNFTSSLMDVCSNVLSPHAIPGLYFFRFPEGQIEQESSDISLDIQSEVGRYDASTFFDRHGCNGPISKKVFGALDRFFKR